MLSMLSNETFFQTEQTGFSKSLGDERDIITGADINHKVSK